MSLLPDLRRTEGRYGKLDPFVVVYLNESPGDTVSGRWGNYRRSFKGAS